MKDEIYYCYDAPHLLKSVGGAREARYFDKRAITYNEGFDMFWNYEGMVDISGLRIFPRTMCRATKDEEQELLKKMLEAILRKGGIPVVTREQERMTEQWLKYYQTKRKMIVATGEELTSDEELQSTIMQMGGPQKKIFIKTLKKGTSYILTPEEIFDENSVFYQVIREKHLDTSFIVSEAIEALRDEYGPKEYRCVILNGKLNSISRYTDTLLHRIDPKVAEAADRVVGEMAQVEGWSSFYVLDLFEYMNAEGEEVIDVVEFNGISAAGTFLYNTVDVENRPDLLHEDEYGSIAPENRFDREEFLQKLENLRETRESNSCAA